MSVGVGREQHSHFDHMSVAFLLSRAEAAIVQGREEFLDCF